jgi:hypothetical protein
MTGSHNPSGEEPREDAAFSAATAGLLETQ